MANVLIVYATREGQTEKIARRLAQTLGASGHGVELVDAEHPIAPLELERFQVAVVGAPIRARG